MATRIFIFMLAAASVVLVAPPGGAQAQAQPAEPPPELDAQQLNIARSLFEEGLDFMDRKDWTQAADRFSRVLQMRWSPVVAYNLGSTLVELGEIGDAVEHLRRVMREPALEDSVRLPAEQLLKQAEARLGKIRILILGEDEGLVVMLDDSEWPKAAIGIPVPLAPGRHRVVLQQGAEELEAREIFVSEREQLDVTFDRTPEEEPAAVPAPAAVAASAPGNGSDDGAYNEFAGGDEADDGGSILGAWWLWTAVGVVVAAATVVTVVAVSSDPDPATPIEGNFMPGVIEGNVQ